VDGKDCGMKKSDTAAGTTVATSPLSLKMPSDPIMHIRQWDVSHVQNWLEENKLGHLKDRYCDVYQRLLLEQHCMHL